jgi:hypothetical protein
LIDDRICNRSTTIMKRRLPGCPQPGIGTGRKPVSVKYAALLDRLGDAYHGAGDAAAARRAWAQALHIFGQIDHPDGDPVRGKLSASGRRPRTARPVVG